MYLLKMKISHIVHPEFNGMIMEDFSSKGDTLCKTVSAMRKEGKVASRKWILRTTYSGKLCKNCLQIERQRTEMSLKLQREEFQRTGDISGRRSTDTGARSDG